MSEILTMVLAAQNHSLSDVSAYCTHYRKSLPVFQPFPELGNLSVIDHLLHYGKIKTFTFRDLLFANILNCSEKNSEGLNLTEFLLKKNSYYFLYDILWYGVKLPLNAKELTTDPFITRLLNYHPGPGQPSIFSLSSSRTHPLEKVRNALLDYGDTTDDSDSEPEPLDNLDIPSNMALSSCTDPFVFAARGVHFSPSFFSKKTSRKVRAEKRVKKTTCSQSTLLDSGYSADTEADENNPVVQTINSRNVHWISALASQPDRKEKKIGQYTPPASRQKIIFQNLFYRFMQVYINSYSTLFNKHSITSDFQFYSNNNPCISLSWSFEKAAMYGSGVRFNWESRAGRKNPHYRRSTKKPKHPNVGYLDIYQLPSNYVTQNSVDRSAMHKNKQIFLNSMYEHEEEVIFFGMIPKKYHHGRYILTLPSLERDFRSAKSDYAKYGIVSPKTYNLLLQAVVSGTRNRHSDSELYAESLKKITELSANAQAQIIHSAVLKHCDPLVFSRAVQASQTQSEGLTEAARLSI